MDKNFKVGDHVHVEFDAEVAADWDVDYDEEVQINALFRGVSHWFDIPVDAVTKVVPPLPTAPGTVLYEYDDDGSFVATIVRVGGPSAHYWLSAETGDGLLGVDHLIKRGWENGNVRDTKN